ncbi:hypothetical protein V8C86DRAFT_2683470 [Haematococcus lacustris]
MPSSAPSPRACRRRSKQPVQPGLWHLVERLGRQSRKESLGAWGHPPPASETPQRLLPPLYRPLDSRAPPPCQAVPLGVTQALPSPSLLAPAPPTTHCSSTIRHHLCSPRLLLLLDKLMACRVGRMKQVVPARCQMGWIAASPPCARPRPPPCPPRCPPLVRHRLLHSNRPRCCSAGQLLLVCPACRCNHQLSQPPRWITSTTTS